MLKSPRNPAEALRLGTYLSLYSFEKDGWCACAGIAAGIAAAAAATAATEAGVPGALFVVPLVVPFLRRRVGVPNGVAGADALDVPARAPFTSSSSIVVVVPRTPRRRDASLSGVLGGVIVRIQ